MNFRRGRLPPPPNGFVDIHSHIVPGVDDGAPTWEVAMEMLRRAARGGTTLIVATPHGDSRAKWHETDALRESCQQLNVSLAQEGVPLSIVLGMENPLELDLAERLEEGSALTYNSFE